VEGITGVWVEGIKWCVWAAANALRNATLF
jgi:hypothetical protein